MLTSTSQLQIQQSVRASFYRRSRFFLQYLEARMSSKSWSRLIPIVQNRFNHPWVDSVELGFRASPGNDHVLRRLWDYYKSSPTEYMHWDAPVTISLFRRRKGKAKQPALCASLYQRKKIIFIRQMQGVRRTQVPKELQPWSKLFIDACRVFACRENFTEIRVPKASALYSYQHPYINASLSPEDREIVTGKIRSDMELLYDTNALALGFVSDGDWYKWKNL